MKDNKSIDQEVKSILMNNFRLHTPNFLKELLEFNPEVSKWANIPVKTLQGLFIKIATRASQLNDPELNLLMAQMTLYAVVDPKDEAYNENALEEIARKYVESKLKRS